MAPEQAQGQALDQRADLFSLGSVLYVMCSGRPPFRASTPLAVLNRVAEDTPRPIQEIIPEVPDWLCAIIARLHAKEPDKRFASAHEVAELLARHLPRCNWPLPRERSVLPPAASSPSLVFHKPASAPASRPALAETALAGSCRRSPPDSRRTRVERGNRRYQFSRGD